MSMEEVVGHLRQVEERRKKKVLPAQSPADPIYNKQGRLLLSEEEWLTKLKLRGDDGDSSSSNSGGKKRGKVRRGRGRSAPRDPSKLPSTPHFKCNKTGHWARDCPNKPNKGQAHVAQGEEDNPTLLMAHAVSFVIPAAATTPARSPPPP